MFERQNEDTPFIRGELWIYMYLYHFIICYNCKKKLLIRNDIVDIWFKYKFIYFEIIFLIIVSHILA